MNKKAFTLIELLVVVVIIGILAAIAFPKYLRSIERSRIADALVTMKRMRDYRAECELLYGPYSAANQTEYNKNCAGRGLFINAEIPGDIGTGMYDCLKGKNWEFCANTNADTVTRSNGQYKFLQFTNNRGQTYCFKEKEGNDICEWICGRTAPLDLSQGCTFASF